MLTTQNDLYENAEPYSKRISRLNFEKIDRSLHAGAVSFSAETPLGMAASKFSNCQTIASASPRPTADRLA